jgi:hypothetical protein
MRSQTLDSGGGGLVAQQLRNQLPLSLFQVGQRMHLCSPTVLVNSERYSSSYKYNDI